jgi:hypothetical protein
MKGSTWKTTESVRLKLGVEAHDGYASLVGTSTLTNSVFAFQSGVE